MEEIIPNLFLGAFPDSSASLEENRISHLAKASSEPLSIEFSKYPSCLQTIDVSSEELSIQIAPFTSFIDHSLRCGGRVLVCGPEEASVAILTAFLMHHRTCPPSDAYAELCHHMPRLNPTPPDFLALLEQPSQPAAYKCRMCRKTLFTDEDLVEHTKAQHPFLRGTRATRPTQVQCTSYFLAELPWGDQCKQGDRLLCPHCRAKLGSWSWAGQQCSCGTWVTPAFQIVGSKVDRFVPQMSAAPTATPT
eukprot:gnl/Trimastix_PCT/3032.p1 GENE.gnl/Trimastix_PCT/3032~~gnl/Trimastix_PCT/3032.p1  ORF type:complete len:278 (+),score=9.08 gnl/Trimastix_PCT/3032:89-835(+)